jgi:signal transduction histidine kinase
VRETIQAHQGEIFVESEPGKGLAFHLYLPVAGEK